LQSRLDAASRGETEGAILDARGQFVISRRSRPSTIYIGSGNDMKACAVPMLGLIIFV
jgi:hypothetical protein